jgi:hypothetical protein
LGDFIEKNTADVSVKYVIKDNSDWPEFVESVCTSHGFQKKYCPMVYTLEGDLIGDGRTFIEHIKEKYNKTIQVERNQLKA